MKKPSLLKNKEEVKHKRVRDVPQNFADRKKDYDELKALRQRLKEKNKQNVSKVRNERKRVEEMRRRKEINDFKSGKFDIIKNPEKIKKWKTKARRMLQKIPPEIFYEKVGKK